MFLVKSSSQLQIPNSCLACEIPASELWFRINTSQEVPPPFPQYANQQAKPEIVNRLTEQFCYNFG